MHEANSLRQLATSSARNAPFIEELYEQLPRRSGSVSRDWRAYFDELQQRRRRARRRARAGRRVVRRSSRKQPAQVARRDGRRDGRCDKQVLVLQLISAYRTLGHAPRRPRSAEAPGARRTSPSSSLRTYGLTEADMDTVFDVGSLRSGRSGCTLRDICGAAGDLLPHASAPSTCTSRDRRSKRWIQERLEPIRSHAAAIAAEQKQHILERLTAAETLERYLHTKYVGQKRFSLEGGDSLIPLLDDLIQRAGEQRRAGDRDRHGASRPPQRAGEHARQDAVGPVRRVRRQARRSELPARAT